MDAKVFRGLPGGEQQLCTKVPSVFTLMFISGRPEAHQSPSHYDERAFLHRIRVPLDQILHGGNLLCNPHLDEANNARMRQAAHKDQFAKILVFGDEHTLLFIRER